MMIYLLWKRVNFDEFQSINRAQKSRIGHDTLQLLGAFLTKYFKLVRTF